MRLNIGSSVVLLGDQNQRLPRRLLLMSLLNLVVFSGCGGENAQDRLNQAIPESQRQSVVPLSGTVTLDGKPSPDLMVRLVKDGEGAPDSTSPKSVTDSSGRFEFTTYLSGDGVPPGKYAVLVEQLTKAGTAGWSGPDQLKNRFNHVKEPAAALQVKSGEPQVDAKIDLVTADKKPKPAPKYSASVATGKPVKKMGKR